MLVAIAVVAVLIAIALPALRGARQAARETAALSDIKQLGAMVTQFAMKTDERLPHVGADGDPGAGYRVLLADGSQEAVATAYFRANMNFFTAALASSGFVVEDVIGYDEREIEAWRERYDRSHLPSRFLLTHAAAAAPAFWRGDDPPFDPAHFTAQPVYAVAFPSSKVALLEHPSPEPGDPQAPLMVRMAAFDGSAKHVEHGFFEAFGRGFGSVPWRGLMTDGGLEGRDD